MKRWYTQYAFRSILRNRYRAIFGIFCIAAGVATIVALRSLGLMIQESLAANVAAANHGDMRISPTRLRQVTLRDGRGAFSQDDAMAIEQWARQHQTRTMSAIGSVYIQIARLGPDNTVDRPRFTLARLIDPQMYPFYGPIRATIPSNTLLADLLTHDQDIVISSNIAQDAHIQVGDRVRISRTDTPFTVRGIVPVEAEVSLLDSTTGPYFALFGFVYIQRTQSGSLKTEDLPDQIYMLAPPNADVERLAETFRLDFPGLKVTTTSDLRRDNQNLAGIINQLTVMMGLVALLMGSVGIMHTMLVSVGHRTAEIAVLKTLGARNGQIVVVFLTESTIMGAIGSSIGLILGLALSLGARAFAQSIWPQAITWRVYPEATLSGLVLGTVLTGVFCFLPTVRAVSVRPKVVLHPEENSALKAGLWPTILALLLATVVVGTLVGGIIGDGPVGLGGTAVLLVMALVLIAVLRLLVMVLGRLPALGIVDLRLALSGIRAYPARTAATLLMLIAGIFSLSLLLFMTLRLPAFFAGQAQSGVRANLLVLATVPQVQRPFVAALLSSSPGVVYSKRLGVYNTSLAAVNGNPRYVDDMSLPGTAKTSRDQTDAAQLALGALVTLDLSMPGFIPPRVTEGRYLAAQDIGKAHAVFNKTDEYGQAAHIHPGDKVNFRVGSREVVFEVVGVTDWLTLGSSWDVIGSFGNFTIPADTLPADASPVNELTIAQVDDTHLNQVMLSLSLIPGVVSFDIGLLRSLIQYLLSQFTTVPIVVAILLLFIGAVVMTNAIALTTLERRRQMGILKAIGLKGYRAVFQLALENSLVGFGGGLIGLGLSGLLLLVVFGAGFYGADFPWVAIPLLLGLALAISVVATILGTWSVVHDKPIRVLRFE